VYNNANKVFQLHRHKPIGLMTWGLGHISSASIATLAKDLRRRLMGQDLTHADWELAPGYTVQAVAARVVEMMHGELYGPEYTGSPAPFPFLGFLVGGYSDGEKSAEAWTVEINDPSTPPIATMVADKDDSGWWAFGQPEAIGRLWNGVDPKVIQSVATAATGAPNEQTINDACKIAVTPAGPSQPWSTPGRPPL